MMTLIKRLHILGFGALFSGGVAGLWFCIDPDAFSHTSSFLEVCVAGGLIGAGVQGVLEKCLRLVFLGPVGQRVLLYATIWELQRLARIGLIGQERARRRREKLVDEVLLGSIPQPLQRS